MLKHIPIETLKPSVQAFLRELNVERERCIIEMDGKPMIGLAPPEEIERNERFAVYDVVWSRNRENKIGAREVDEAIAEALQAVSGRKL